MVLGSYAARVEVRGKPSRAAYDKTVGYGYLEATRVAYQVWSELRVPRRPLRIKIAKKCSRVTKPLVLGLRVPRWAWAKHKFLIFLLKHSDFDPAPIPCIFLRPKRT
jgi:hypothetical protein